MPDFTTGAPRHQYDGWTRVQCRDKALNLLADVQRLRNTFAELEEEEPDAVMQSAADTREVMNTAIAEAHVWAVLSTGGTSDA